MLLQAVLLSVEHGHQCSGGEGAAPGGSNPKARAGGSHGSTQHLCPEASGKLLLSIPLSSSPPWQVSSAITLPQIYIRAGEMRIRTEALKATFFFLEPDIKRQPDLP